MYTAGRSLVYSREEKPLVSDDPHGGIREPSAQLVICKKEWAELEPSDSASSAWSCRFVASTTAVGPSAASTVQKNMRWLLLAAAVFAPTWAFSLSNFFSFSEDTTMRLHPLSPPEREPMSARAKRQAYQVFVDGDTAVTVDKSGQKETGNWGPWTPEQGCSRTCGGGVQVEKRQCSGSCTGPSVRYVSCNLEACPAGTDYRAEQCAAHNDDPLDGNYHKWKPYKGKNKCELVCKPEIGNFYYKWADKVVDGTKCDSKSDDICVDGECLSVGCDGKLGSSVKFDKCGKCDGDGSTCKTIEGHFDERNLSPGYHDIIKLPEGATSIKIQEARKSSNNLALKNSSEHFYLNGNALIQVEKDVEVAGTVFEYDDADPETLSARGPLDEELTVALLFRKGNRDAAIKYEFSIPLDEEIDYFYKFDAWTPCSVTCGKGVQTRNLYCVDGKSQGRVGDDLCEENNATKPEFEKSCETVDCEAEWFTGDWEDCSATCGDRGEQYRVVYCHQVFANGRRVTVDDGNCTSARPAVRQNCNRFACPEWQAGPWSACSQNCGDAHQYRSVTCRSEKEGEEGKLLSAEQCPAEDKSKYETERSCNLGPCEGLTFVTGDWKLCTKCNDTEETREVTCKDTQGRAYPLEKCLVDNSTEIPADTRSCATQPPCIYEWTASEWSKCSTECGHGHKTRRVVCAIHQEGDLEVVDESHCQADKPEIKTNCTNEEKCTGTWFTAPWGKCSAECDGGTQERVAVCLNYDRKPVPEWCDEDEKPDEKQDCNTDPCPNCFDSEFGCCPDNSTFAKGDFNEGCSNCTLSEFGCCADNYTTAAGPNGLGCDEFSETPLSLLLDAEGSGEAATTEATSSSAILCNVTSGDGEEASVECAIMQGNATLLEGDLFGNGTDANGTVHCSKTEFGCCPDWYTPAEGKNKEGCPEFELGACNETKYGCCHDDVTLARGPNLEGCGEPSCAASLFGCCKDRKTIAFGPHYAGCERSSFPCELSEFGCCPDGETAALGRNGTGCGENCLTTKFGCCPDGKTTAKGHHNEGCGCEFAQYGCCPDGKTPAKGAGFYGCPESCAQSQYGCCPDGKTRARGEHKEGCPCQYTRYGCCPDGETTALGPRNDGCDDCRYAKYQCCPDGETKALGPDYAGCPSTTLAPFLLGGTVAPPKIVSCSQPQDIGTVCSSGYKLVWYYDTAEGRCSQFWYGGCDGNENRFTTKEMCETICVEPPGTGRCYLPKVEGPLRCDQPQARYWYDYTTKQCAAFWWRGCLGNANNFASWEECSTTCKNVGPYDQPTTPAPPPQQQQQYRPEYPLTSEFEIEPQAPQQQPQPQPEQQQQPQQLQERPPAPTMEQVCRSPQDAGPCEQYSDQWFYNAYSRQCETFVYGGCGGNLNRFRTKEECEQRCSFLNGQQPSQQQAVSIPSAGQPAPAPEVPQTQQVAPAPASPSSGKNREACHLAVDKGRCKGAFDSWYYEVATGTCVSFKYTGCGGNANRFPTRDQCEDLCVHSAAEQAASDGAAGTNSVCDEAKDTGPCLEFVTKWYYNKTDGTCNRFHYGGCKGTNNRFDNEQQCKASCANHKDACTLPKVQGPCSGKHTYYYFNAASQACETFVYGGCLGNTNRFNTVEECQQRCQPQAPTELYQIALRSPKHNDVQHDEPRSSEEEEEKKENQVDCHAPADSGECRKFTKMFYYSPTIGSCESFSYGGCGGNSNRFSTIQDCNTACSKHQNLVMLKDDVNGLDANEQVLTVHDDRDNSEDGEDGKEYVLMDTSSSALPELCLLPEERGSCYGEILRWRYNSENGNCVSFMYSGCNANANHFTSEEFCERSCGRFRDVKICDQPKDEGTCDMGITKWYYEPKSAQCKMMMWGGCAGNGNRFSAKSDCESLCTEESSWNSENFCELPRSSGPCMDSISMWYFDSSQNECKQFTYGGCRGNGNRFVSKNQCQKSCAPKMQEMKMVDKEGETALLKKRALKEVCNLPFESGPCGLTIPKYFFDPSSGTCKEFSYSGCEGNLNRFDTVHDCLMACGSVQRIISVSTVPTIKMDSRGPFEAGEEIRIRCVTSESEKIWYKDGNLLQFDLRITKEEDPSTLVISKADLSDSGSYSCSSDLGGGKSEEIFVEVVKREPTKPPCVDRGSTATCSLIVRNGLCGRKRYGDFCCLTCSKQL
ncbi:unnamed protein product [Caenorhabditis auriculariae]|uniref:Papilin n=1 Tax=Caenorhabditis auriculariae TaxID=2777116 RepID=A0A8S1GUI7_9PELO|nr:unnamed protein product [Caenorhabditis auriculariae]